jgi:hypothetical protein
LRDVVGCIVFIGWVIVTLGVAIRLILCIPH